MTSEQKNQLENWVRAPSTPQKIVLRARICLMAHEGLPNNRIARDLKTSRPTVLLWRQHFLKSGVTGLEHEPPRKISSQRTEDKQIKAIVEATLHTKPDDATHWSSRTLAEKFGVSHMTVARIWDSHGLQPHRVRHFKLSRDKQFVEKLTDVVGLYLNPPDKALVLCVDEKSQIQALDRTQPGLPMKKGRCGTMTHDYLRHGTTTLFAALNVLDGSVIGSCFERHRHERVSEVPSPSRSRHSHRYGPAPDRGQLFHAQASESEAMDRTPQEVPPALHSHQFLLAEFGRTMVC